MSKFLNFLGAFLLVTLLTGHTVPAQTPVAINAATTANAGSAMLSTPAAQIANSLSSLPEAFAKIAAELRIQYAIGYYPANKTRDGLYRKIKVTTSRKNVVVRARPGYRAAKTN